MADFIQLGDTGTFKATRFELAAAMVHCLESELHRLTSTEQDFVMSVLSEGHVACAQLDALLYLCDKLNV